MTDGICGHTYTRKSGRTARCTAKPHPNKPDAHYFEWVSIEEQATLLHPQARVHGRMIVIPGERHDR